MAGSPASSETSKARIDDVASAAGSFSSGAHFFRGRTHDIQIYRLDIRRGTGQPPNLDLV